MAPDCVAAQTVQGKFPNKMLFVIKILCKVVVKRAGRTTVGAKVETRAKVIRWSFRRQILLTKSPVKQAAPPRMPTPQENGHLKTK